jgi:hypothetical protein
MWHSLQRPSCHPPWQSDLGGYPGGLPPQSHRISVVTVIGVALGDKDDSVRAVVCLSSRHHGISMRAMILLSHSSLHLLLPLHCYRGRHQPPPMPPLLPRPSLCCSSSPISYHLLSSHHLRLCASATQTTKSLSYSQLLSSRCCEGISVGS